MTILNRRRFLLLAAGAAIASPAFPPLSRAQNASGAALHGLSAFGDLKYPGGFARFDQANPEAPRGGTFNFQPGYYIFNQSTQTFNTLNSFVRRGDSPPRMEITFDSLCVSSFDEPDAVYCHLAENVTISEDRNRFTFRLRAIARWHDGAPITAADVKFSYETLKTSGHPQLLLPLESLTGVIVEDDRTVTLVFDGTQSAQAILAIATYPILPAAWFANQAFDAATMQPIPGSGPYRVGRFQAGSFIEYDRVEDYWGDAIGTRAGLNHFQRLRFEFFVERQPAFEAFKKGDITWREEFTAKSWATEYDFPALRDGKVIKRLFDDEARPRMQAWALNQRRARFADQRVRDAIGLCFDFEWTNQNLFYGAYARSHSLFSGSDYEAAGLPDAAELALIERLSAEHAFPDGIKGEAYLQPASDGSGRDRTRLRQASVLLAEAGWTSIGGDGLVRSAAGEALDLEMLINASVFERIYGPFVETMRSVGINASLRLIDPAQYQARMGAFDFDMAGYALSFGGTPTEDSLENVLGSKAASVEGSRNWTGAADPLTDALIAEVGRADSREAHRTAMRVLDRVLRLRRDWIPNWTSANHRVAYWDMFGFSEDKPAYLWPVETLWWFDEEKARAIGRS